jgi:tetratricopeptide (TPR) repeat protein
MMWCSARPAVRVALAACLAAALAAPAAAQTGRASGVVHDETGEPVKGATVRAENPVGEPRSFTASTDDRGRFTMVGLRPGNWTFTVEAPGYDSQAASLRIQAQGMPTQPLLFSLAKTFGGPVAALGSLSPKDLQAALAEADQLFNNKQWDEALARYQDILTRTPALSVINLQIGAIDRAEGNYDAAITAYRALLDASPGNSKALVGLAMANVERGDLDAAEAPLLAAASDAETPNRDVLLALGDVRAARGDADGAAAWYRRASQADPYWGRPLYKLGRQAMDRGDNATAIALMRKVLETDPLSPDAAEAQAALSSLRP